MALASGSFAVAARDCVGHVLRATQPEAICVGLLELLGLKAAEVARDTMQRRRHCCRCRATTTGSMRTAEQSTRRAARQHA